MTPQAISVGSAPGRHKFVSPDLTVAQVSAKVASVRRRLVLEAEEVGGDTQDVSEQALVQVVQLQHALDSRPHTDHVVGMLMLVMGCSEQVAWATLSRISQNTNRKVAAIADAVVAQVSQGAGLPADLAGALREAMPPRRP